MPALTFKAPILIREGNPYVLVSSARAKTIKPDWKKPLPVLIQINGQPNPPWRINMMPVGNGSFYLYLHGDVRKASQTGVGDTVQVKITFDPTYKNGPMHPMPPWFKSALTKTPNAKQSWEALPPSRQKELLRYLANLKSKEAQERNTKKAIEVLSGITGRFMARTWKEGK